MGTTGPSLPSSPYPQQPRAGDGMQRMRADSADSTQRRQHTRDGGATFAEGEAEQFDYIAAYVNSMGESGPTGPTGGGGGGGQAPRAGYGEGRFTTNFE
jgi:hypothetical protein